MKKPATVYKVSKLKQFKLSAVIPAKAGIQRKNTGFRIKPACPVGRCGMTE